MVGGAAKSAAGGEPHQAKPIIASNPREAAAGANAVREWLERWIVEGEFNEIGGGRDEEQERSKG